MTDRETADLTNSYTDFYRVRDPVHVYPVEFVVRAFLGNYPRLKTDHRAYSGKTVLDVGFGDGRNMPLLHNLGMTVSGVEISDEICRLSTSRMERLGPGGSFAFSAPMATSYILRGALNRGDNHMEITYDPYGVRAGTILKKFDSESDIEAALSPDFRDFAIGSCRNDFWGIEEHVWIVVCRKAC